MLLKNFKEKDFIKKVLSKYAITAAKDKFDDCICIDLEELTCFENPYYLVYSLDHPSFIKRKGMSIEEQYRFYGKWAAACTLGDVLAMGATPKGFSWDLSAPLDIEVRNIENMTEGLVGVVSQYGANFEGGNFDAGELETVCMAWGIVEKEKINKKNRRESRRLYCSNSRLRTRLGVLLN